MVYFDDFYGFPKIFKFLPIIAQFLGKKHLFFCRRGKNLGKWFSTESLCVFSKMVQLTQIMVQMLLGVPSRTPCSDFLIFWVSAFLWRQICDKRGFFGKKNKLMTKNAILSWIRLYKMAKTQNIKKSLHGVLEGTLRNISTINWVNWTIFEKTHRLSVENHFPKFLPRRQKNGCFLPKNRAISG